MSGLEGVDQYPGHLEAQIFLHLIFFNERFPDAWIGRGGPIPWPPRSPDLSPLDFFNERFPDASIGKGGPIPWPPRSPNLSPLDFFK